MKRIIFILITFITLGQMSARERYEGCIYLSAEKNGDTLDCTLHNASKDTVYLFNSYLSGAFDSNPHLLWKGYDSPYLRRYDPYDRSFTISYRPLIQALVYNPQFLSDRLITNERRVVRPGQVLFSLLGIDPDSSVTFRLPLDLIYNREYIEDFRPLNEKIDILKRGYDKIYRNKNEKKYYNDTGIVTLEVAVYRHENIRQLLHPYYSPKVYCLDAMKVDPFLGSEDLNRIVTDFIPVTLTILTSD